MREIQAKIKLINYEDMELYAEGSIKDTQIRVVEEEGIIDTNLRRLIIPSRLFEKLGLRKMEEIDLSYLYEVKANIVASAVVVEIKGRKAITLPIVEETDKILVGRFIIEEMDFYVDAVTGEIKPRHPEAKGPVEFIGGVK